MSEIPNSCGDSNTSRHIYHAYNLPSWDGLINIDKLLVAFVKSVSLSNLGCFCLEENVPAMYYELCIIKLMSFFSHFLQLRRN